MVNIGQQTLTSSSPHFGDYKMSVDGKVVARKYVATELNWADDEFAKPLSFDSLISERNFVNRNSHLKGVPPEKEISSFGVEMGEMLALQMRKTEQLFRYSFLFYDEITALKNENAELKKLISELEKRIGALEKK